MVILGVGHLATDFASGALPALLPFLKDRFDLSYTLIAALMLAATVSSALVQPAFGLVSDRRGALWLLPAGAAVAGACMALVTVASSFWLVFALVLLAGLGIAAFHPEGAKFASYASGRDRARGMGYFNIGGNLGYALGAFTTTPLVLHFGLGGGAAAFIPVLVVAGLLLRSLPALRRLRPAPPAARAAAGPDRIGATAVLGGVIVLRSFTWFALLTFASLWWESQGHTREAGNRVLWLMLFAGAAGTLVIGPIADRVGLRATLIVTQALLGPLTAIFVLVGGAIAVIAVALVGVCVVGSFAVTMVLNQQFLPRHLGMASGISVGLAMGLGGVASVVLGAFADGIDLRTALLISAAAPVFGTFLALRLPRDADPQPARAGRQSAAAELGHSGTLP